MTKSYTIFTLPWMLTVDHAFTLNGGELSHCFNLGVIAPSGYCRVFPQDILNCKTVGRNLAHKYYHFHFLTDFRQENQKLKELVTGGATAAGSSTVPSHTDAAEAKEEPVKEESVAVRPKMEATTPQKVVK